MATKLLRLSRGMGKAAAEGSPAKLRQLIEQIQVAAGEVEKVTCKVCQSWSDSDEDVSEHLKGGYTDELIAATKSLGISLTRLDDRLAAFPVVVQILPKQRAVRIDKIRLTSLRPSTVAKKIESQIKKSHIRPEQFIEILHKCYQFVGGEKKGGGVPLVEIYDALTMLPDARESYSRAEFARDVYLLDNSRVRSTKSEARVSFPSGTGTRGGKSITVVPPSGMPKYYYGLRFEGGS
ncbi:MAG: hypothetical protein ACR2FY_16815 [Pirellulaceae bacterium]